jgi:hypothetical protein
MKRPSHLSELNVSRKREAMTALLRREVTLRNRVRVKAVSRHLPKQEVR